MKRKITKSEVSQTINLKEFFGRNVTTPEKEAFVSRAIEKIIGRTQDGKSIKNRKFPQYSGEYAESKGVSRGDVDLTLFGDMLLSMNSENQRRNLIKLKIDDSNEAVKAFAHSTGFEGHPTIKDGPKRDFFGLNKKEITEIVKQVNSGDTPSVFKTATPELRQKVIDNIFSSLGFEFVEGQDQG